jgi:hypothetical protein
MTMFSQNSIYLRGAIQGFVGRSINLYHSGLRISSVCAILFSFSQDIMVFFFAFDNGAESI